MVTGHRRIEHPSEVQTALEWLLASIDSVEAISGGAEGADTLFARAALEVGVPLRLYLPNRYYRQRYDTSVPDDIVDGAIHVFHIVMLLGRGREDNPADVRS
jgi:hypothetical protein